MITIIREKIEEESGDLLTSWHIQEEKKEDNHFSPLLLLLFLLLCLLFFLIGKYILYK